MNARRNRLAMKRCFALAAMLGVAWWTAPLSAQPHATNAATITVAAVRGIPGSTVSVPLSFSHTGIVAAVQYDLSYNPARMTAGALQAGVISNHLILRSRQIAPGVHRVLLYDGSVGLLPTNTVVGGLPFTVPAGQLSGGGRIAISNAVVSSLSATSVIPVRSLHGAVLVETVYRAPDGVVDLFLTVQSNRMYVVQATTNFVNWVNIATNFATLDYVIAQDLDAVNHSARFYRAVSGETVAGGKITGVSVATGNQLIFGYSTISGRTYLLQTSTNLTGWDNLTTNLATGTLLNFTNLISPSEPGRYFRILASP